MDFSELFKNQEDSLNTTVKLSCDYPGSTGLTTDNVLATKAKGLVMDNNEINGP